jgi:hypothetical protein
MAGLKWNTGKLYYSTVELGYQQYIILLYNIIPYRPYFYFNFNFNFKKHETRNLIAYRVRLRAAVAKK